MANLSLWDVVRFRKSLMRKYLLALLFFLIIFYTFSVLHLRGFRKAPSPRAKDVNGSTLESSHSFSGELQKLDRYWTHIHQARYNFEAGDYSNAKKEYELAIQCSRSNGDIWMARALLKDMYIKTGNNADALKEIDWLYDHNPREDVRRELLLERQKIS